MEYEENVALLGDIKFHIVVNAHEDEDENDVCYMMEDEDNMLMRTRRALLLLLPPRSNAFEESTCDIILMMIFFGPGAILVGTGTSHSTVPGAHASCRQGARASLLLYETDAFGPRSQGAGPQTCLNACAHPCVRHYSPQDTST